ncbi:hypothetical protein LO763_10350 [Glycomyces sp. A-F 0318]|uniref:carbohydrate-binding domain-containing protein n=1 Tax=Glycomyces amatae TaxID=2881355 RepID=UPI001E39E40D|nr:carbohydrate-binding domain-containing protein [Glycomyces amatae]MCD0444023.1 hypothetical protein [Glycomyces amatae]
MKRRLAILFAACLTMLGLGLAGASPATAQDYPYCANGSASDPDGDGWGWENNQSCIVQGGSADPNGGGYPTCQNGSASDPDGDGWGWENGRSCIVQGGGGGSLTCPSNAECGSYAVSGLGQRKQQIIAYGGTTLDLAIAMLETDTMTTNYAYGDNKTYDAANFGIFKQNWHMLRNSCSWFTGQSINDWNNGALLNSDLGADLYCRHQAQSHYGEYTWFAGHRNGETGLNDPGTDDIDKYRTAVYWIKGRLESDSANLSNDTRFWVDVEAI